MPVATKDLRNKTQLRAEASFLLKIGVATGGEWALGADTLGLLFKLASSPDTVMDGLKLLHELQTHQVELDMQHQELERTLQFYDKEKSTNKSLFENAPFGYLVVQADGIVLQSNLAASALLGLKPHACNGRKFGSLCTTLSAYTLDDLMKQVVVQGATLVSVLELKPAKHRPKRLQVLISKDPDSEHYLFGLSNYDQLLKV